MKKVTELTKAVSINYEDLLMIVQNGENKQIEYEQLLPRKYIIQTSETILANTEYELPCSYVAGDNNLEIYVEGVLLSRNHNYEEVGETGTVSNIIKFGWDIEAGSIITLKVTGMAGVNNE